MSELNHIIRLLQNSPSSLAGLCLQSVSRRAVASVITTGPVPAKELLDIYAKRARVNEATGKSIIGFPEVLNRLGSDPSARICVVALEEKERKFVLFLDQDETEVLGILLIPF